ncbi:hypothetical protein [Allocoleopsis sp.]|uniref:hypothetical protein n=1 Tax=Allocoleopsis sp. TaxID=3088169 RepID=UPI002FD53541
MHIFAHLPISPSPHRPPSLSPHLFLRQERLCLEFLPRQVEEGLQNTARQPLQSQAISEMDA